MALVNITYDDLVPFAPDLKKEKADAMIEDVLARAVSHAPQIADNSLDEQQAQAGKGILRRVILRWNDSGSGAVTQSTTSAGPYSQSQTVDNKSGHKKLFYEDELADLKALGQEVPSMRGKAFSIDMSKSRVGTNAVLQPGHPFWFQFGE